MMRHIAYRVLAFQAAFSVGLFASVQDAKAANNFSSIAGNITESIEDLPGLVAAIAYMMGILLGVLGIMKVKDHVENPTQTPLKDGAIRMASGGALFGLPIVYESMLNTIGTTSNAVGAAKLHRVEFTTL